MQVRDTQILILEDNEHNSALGSSFHVSSGGELRLPSSVSLQGSNNILSGLNFCSALESLIFSNSNIYSNDFIPL